MKLFQSTLPREERQRRTWIKRKSEQFQSTLPREERRFSSSHLKNPDIFQSTLPREERPIIGGIKSMRKFISIHAPTRGATHRSAQLQQAHSISIHAPTRGATDKRAAEFYVSKISIHAPTRGATITFFRCWNRFSIFQSTLPREERRCSLHISSNTVYFNPRSHERSDNARKYVERLINEFQSTLPREERLVSTFAVYLYT